MPGSPSSIAARGALRAAAAVTVRRIAPGHGVPQAHHLALLAESELIPAPAQWTDASIGVLAAQIAARSRQNVPAGRGGLDSYFDGTRLRRPASLSPGMRSTLYAVAAEYSCARGDVASAADFAEEAALFAQTPAQTYHALSTSAAAAAMNGEIRAAADDVRAASAIFRAEHWPLSEYAFAHFLAEFIVLCAQLETAAMRDLISQMRACEARDASWTFALGVCDVTARMLEHDHAGALAESSALLHGAQSQAGHRLNRLSLLCRRSDVLVARAEAEEALSLLDISASPEGHAVCVPGHRATALLSLGRENEVLSATDACVADEAGHGLRTLVFVLVRRALAFARLGNAREAFRGMEAALLVIDRTGDFAMPFLLLPCDEVRSLVQAVAARRPELEAAVTRVLAALFVVAVDSGAGARPVDDGSARRGPSASLGEEAPLSALGRAQS